MKPTTVRIVARRYYAAPFFALINPVYEVSGTVRFEPEDGYYAVNGVLGEDYSAVWIENGQGRQVGEKIEIKGSSALEFFEK